MERLLLVLSLAWESLTKITSMSNYNYSGWLGKWTKKGTQFLTDHLNDDRCVKCGGKLLFDQELTTRRGYTEFALFICTCCGEEHERMVVLD